MPYTPPNKRDPDKEVRERHHRQIIRATWWGIIVVAVSSGVTVWTGLIMRDQALIMRDQIKFMEAQQRPWIIGKPVMQGNSGGLIHTESAAAIMFHVQTRNVGGAVGQGLRIETDLVAIPELGPFNDHPDRFKDTSDTVVEAQRILCSRLEKSSEYFDPETSGDVLFPNEERTDFEIAYRDIDDIRKMMAKHKTGGFIPVIVGCIDYQFYVSSVRHQTGFAYIVRPKNRPSFDNHAVKLDQSFKADALVFEKYSHGNGVAN